MGMSITLDTAMRALMAQQMGVDNVSHNVANASTVGYSRQRLTMHAIPGSFVGDGIPRPGMGVEVVNIDRVRDLFIDYQMRQQFQSAGRYDAQAESLQRLELVLSEPGDGGLRGSLDGFFNSWRDLANAPESPSARTAVVQSGQTFALAANRVYTSMNVLRREADSRLQGAVAEINDLTTEIASLNQQIGKMVATGTPSPDLSDRRDVAIDRLATMLNISYVQQSDGTIDIAVGGHSLVTGHIAQTLVGVPNAANSNYIDIQFQADGLALNTSGGEVRGLIDQRDVDLPARIADLNSLVSAVLTDVNAAHNAGFGLDGVTGRDFFVGTDASDIAVDPLNIADINRVAASATAGGVPGDGSNASIISDLQYAQGLLGGTATYDDFYGNFVASVGVDSAEAQSRLQAQNLVVDQMKLVRDGTSGVNLDEEMVNLTRYQRAYEAASRLVRVADEMLDTLINRTAV
ncbi:MAG: flagellar hook-associated protein FlgK [Dehalococcoidia bacterium]